MGCDLYFCECVLALREVHPDVTLEAAIPCPTQADAWPADQRARYRRLVDACDYETLVLPAVHVLMHAAAGPLYGGPCLAADRRF